MFLGRWTWKNQLLLLGINKSSMEFAGGLSRSRACIGNLYSYVVPVSLVQARAKMRASATPDVFTHTIQVPFYSFRFLLRIFSTCRFSLPLRNRKIGNFFDIFNVNFEKFLFADRRCMRTHFPRLNQRCDVCLH